MIGQAAQGREALAQGSMAALIGANQTIVVAREREDAAELRAARRAPPRGVGPEIPVRCFRCYHVPERVALREVHPVRPLQRLHQSLRLRDQDGQEPHPAHPWRHRDRAARRAINQSEIACHNLTVNGAIDATVDCSGDAVFRHSGTVRGRLYCEQTAHRETLRGSLPDGVMANGPKSRGISSATSPAPAKSA